MQNWHQTRNGLAVTGLGCQDLLDMSMTAFFASRQCPGSAIHAAMDWALQQARAKRVVVSGFHSPLEQSVLKVLMQAHSPVVLVLARPVMSARLSPDWLSALNGCHMTVVSASSKAQRLTSMLAAQRNDLAAQLASNIVVAHTNPAGGLARQCEAWAGNRDVHFL